MCMEMNPHKFGPLHAVASRFTRPFSSRLVLPSINRAYTARTRLDLRRFRSQSVHAMTEPAAKRQKTSHDVTIGTHNGTFHCDEALAVWLLKRTEAYKDASTFESLEVSSRTDVLLPRCDKDT